MIKKYVFIFIAILSSTFYGFGQVTTIDFEVLNAGYTASATFGSGWQDVFNRSNPNRGGNATYMWSVEDIPLTDPSIDLDQIDITGSLDFTFAIDMIAHHYNDWDDSDELLITYSLDGGAYQNLMWIQNAGGEFNQAASLDTNFDGNGDCGSGILPALTTGNSGCNVTSNLFETFTTAAIPLSSNTTLDIKLQFNGLTSTDEGIYLDNIVITETSSCTDSADFNNLQSPATGTITVGGVFNVYAQVYELGVTEAAGQGANIETWIGYSSANTDPSGTGWTWVTANYNIDVGNNDEYILDLGAQIASSGTYYYASRFRLNSCGFTYGGFDSGGGDGFWDGTNDVNGVLTVNADQVNFCNIDFPKTGSIIAGNTFNVYAQAYEPGVTDSPGQGANISAWIGYNTTGINHQPWNATGWTWVAATYDSDSGNNDQYVAQIGSALPAGIYYYASRFQLNGSDYSYGGIAADNVGNFWDATNNNGTLTVTNPAAANVVITEIMYNAPGTDDEWIEICNVSGSTQDISNYIIKISGSLVFTFPASTTIPDGNCITVSLGSNGDGTYNNDCPFTPDFGVSAVTNDTNNLGNSASTITIFASNGTTIIDTVTYDDGDDFTTDGGGSSYHIIDTSANNSSTSSNWQAVNYGGSPGTNSLISLCIPMDPDINVEGNLGTFPDISGDGTNVPAEFNNTLFDARPIGDSQINSFRVQNLGAADLNIASVVITGAGFSASAVATPIASSGVTTFNITFAPLTTGTLTATVEIFSDDPNESPYTFNIKGEGLCATSTITVTNFAPTSGPVGTEVTITGSGFSGSSTVTINGVSANVISSSATELIIEIPSITYSGSFTVTEGSCYTKSSPDFTLLKNNGSCGLSDLIMTEFYDKTSGSLAYIEIYNGTGSSIDLTNYYIRRYGDATNLTDNIYTDYYFTPSISTISDGQVLFGKITATVDIGVNPDFYFADVVFAGINGDDIFHLYNGTTIIDVYIEPLSNAGYTAKRKVNTAGPNATSYPFDWTSTGTESLTDLGIFNYVSSIGTPTVNTPNDVAGCHTSAVFDATGTASGGGVLTYQWYYNEGTPTSSNWNLVTSGAFPLVTVLGMTGPVLTLSGSFYSYSGYQFYCLVIEDGVCGNYSDAAQIKTNSRTWNGSAGTDWNIGANWTPSVVPDSFDCVVIPDVTNDPIISGATNANSGSITVLNGGYLLLLPGGTITVVDEVNVIAGGTFELNGTQQDTAQLIQVNDVNNTGNITLIRETNVRSQDYVYWSSPVENYAVTNFSSNFIFEWNPTTGGPGQHGNWASTSENMIEGKGYAIRLASGNGNNSSTATWQTITFTGVANNGNVLRTINRGSFTGPTILNGPGVEDNITAEDDNWNLIGNPYPSALFADDFINANTNLDGTVYLWTHGTRINNGFGSPFYGNYAYNYSQADYTEYNLSGSTPPGFLGVIGSGQGFFVQMLHAASTPSTVTFDNSMRDATLSAQFFRSSAATANSIDIERHRIWLDLVTPLGNTNTTLIAYVEGATNEKDRRFDAFIIGGNGKNIYSLIEDENHIIQGRSLPFDINDEVSIGMVIDEIGEHVIAINSIDGLFETTDQEIFIDDLALGIIHNIKESPYFFTVTEADTFNDRFVLRFVDNSLSINENVFNTNDLNIIELNNGQVKFTVSDNNRIKSVTIIDVLGRVLYNLVGNNTTETYNLSNLGQSTYIAKVKLFNGYVITKKAIKSK